MTTENPLVKMSRDIRAASDSLGISEIRFLVDAYYQMQGNRIRANNQTIALSKLGEPNGILVWLKEQNENLEKQVKSVLDRWTKTQPVGRWMLSQHGIGPVITAGFLSQIDITKCPTAGHIWSFAGIIGPSQTWEKGERRPWNADLKRLCWILSESFVKVSGKDEAFYGQIYVQRKALENERNERGEFSDQAAQILKTKRISKETVAYKHYSKGKLPPAHIHARASRYAVKIFTSHLHHVWYVEHYKCLPPKPFMVEHGGHAHIITPPNYTGLTY